MPRCREILVYLLQGPVLLVPAGRLPGLYHFLRNPCFPSSQPPRPPSTPAESSHPLFTHQGGCYSLWQQGPWQPASHLGEATLLPWQQRPRQSFSAARQYRFGKGWWRAGGRGEEELMGKGVGQAQAPHSRHSGMLSCGSKEGWQVRDSHCGPAGPDLLLMEERVLWDLN